MTPVTPSVRPAPAQAALRIPSVGAARAAALQAHDDYVSHFNHCDVEATRGRPCTACFELLTWADDAGKRWEMATERAVGGTR